MQGRTSAHVSTVSSALFFDGPRGVALFADPFAGAYVCWRERKPIGARVVFDVEYGEAGADIYPAAVIVLREISQADAQAIARRLDPHEKLARGYWYEVTPE